MFGRVLTLSLVFASSEASSGNQPEKTEIATFAGGCFWCLQPPFDKVDGVIETVVGYTGGTVPNPTYEQVTTGKTGHVEAIQIRFDPKTVSYEQLVDVFWSNIDPSDDGGQFADRGTQYRTVIFFHSEAQRRAAESSKERLGKSGRLEGPVLTSIEAAKAFYPAEDYHQKYYQKSSLRYGLYKRASGREEFIEKTWGDDGARDKELRKRLTPEQFHVTQEGGTERPFENAYWNHKEPGIYVDVVTGEPLFSSLDKYDSGSGWPSFTKPISRGNVVTRKDDSLFMSRVEVRSKGGDAHLGHVFDDGPGPDGARYCINSASLRFVPVADLEKEGYGEFRKLFDAKPTEKK